jgi:hypothetical protein
MAKIKADMAARDAIPPHDAAPASLARPNPARAARAAVSLSRFTSAVSDDEDVLDLSPPANRQFVGALSNQTVNSLVQALTKALPAGGYQSPAPLPYSPFASPVNFMIVCIFCHDIVLVSVWASSGVVWPTPPATAAGSYFSLLY